MNMHEFNLKAELHSLAQAAVGFGVLALVVVGLGGTVYKVVAPDGWLAQSFGRSLSAGAATLGSLALIGVLAWFSRGWTSPRARNRAADLLVYAFAGAGILYLAQLWLKGSL